MCSFSPKLTCSWVCWGPSVKSFHVCGTAHPRSTSGCSYAVGLTWLVFAEMERHPGHKQMSPVSRLLGSGWRQAQGRAFFLSLLPSICSSPNLLPVCALPIPAVMCQLKKKKKEKKAHLPNTLQECGISTPVLGVCTSSVFAPKHKATGASLVAQMAKNLSAVLETWVWSLGRKIPRRGEWQPTLVLLPGDIPWTKEPDGL